MTKNSAYITFEKYKNADFSLPEIRKNLAHDVEAWYTEIMNALEKEEFPIIVYNLMSEEKVKSVLANLLNTMTGKPDAVEHFYKGLIDNGVILRRDN